MYLGKISVVKSVQNYGFNEKDRGILWERKRKKKHP